MSTKEFISIKGARENNLKNVNLILPKNKLIVFTGLSGSGKSSLAFNTIYEEGRRRYVDSLSNYARQFLGGSNKPDVDAIDGLSPSIAIEQKTTHNNPRSTVGTVTEIYDYLRLLFARIGVTYCPQHKIAIKSQTNKDIIESITSLNSTGKIMILSPIVDNEKGTHLNLIDKLRKEGFIRLKVDGQLKNLDYDEINLDKNTKHTIDIVVDRLDVHGDSSRLAEAISVAAEYSKGLVKVEAQNGEIKTFSKLHSCMYKDFEMPKIEPRLFSFNSPAGACEQCKGLGVDLRASFEALVPEPWRSINNGAIKIFENTVNSQNLEWQEFEVLLNHYNIDKSIPIEDLSVDEIKKIKYGSDEEIEFVLISSSGNRIRRSKRIEGILDIVERKYMETSSQAIRDYTKKYMGSYPCSKCNYSRLNKYALAVKINDKNIDDFARLSIEQALNTIQNIDLNENETHISSLIITELINRLSFLQNVGLNYLNLNRSAETLSGGESQRIKLATQVGSNLTGVLYVLDEPSIGLHQRDNDRLIATLKNMVAIGNTLIVVEHDEDTIRAAEHIVDIGPLAGEQGGNIVAQGTMQEIMREKNSLTGQYLSGELKIEVPKYRRSGNGQVVTVKGAKENNLKNIDVKFPLGKFIAVTGISGSGKSTLVNEIFVKGIQRVVNKTTDKIGKFSSIHNINAIDKVIPISQSPIGRTPRSTPATHISVFDDIRDLFASTTEAQARAFSKSNFSFNVPGGRCEKCSGDGVIKIEMHFLPDVYIVCDQCDGHRYTKETLEVKYKNKNISDVLNMSVDQAYEFFASRPKIKQKLEVIKSIGLGYIKLGQPSTTLSGGEAQRVKLATYLHKKATGKTVYVLDEPTTGLHPHDVNKLLSVLNKIVDNGDTVVVIEHNLDVIKCADYVIDLGPEGGINGGKIVASGTPEQVANIAGSYTGQYLKKYLI
ncbi:excinuclease ABC subunit UvrA [Mycoplasmopsis phocirhinis]|uniref:UvrABC system protein A n=1 Tax=Mycoplasmopsis phocirhinis TaxID=142650 RepID=A0A4V0ZAH7_9BACT|nr:excinuclease ABC subunit UvrA [Mycoplasmopsis phocirhinis]QBF34742.1 excinuclease ABC subunit UvrA [Mycoplasmopsis phocirhinis]